MRKLITVTLLVLIMTFAAFAEYEVFYVNDKGPFCDVGVNLYNQLPSVGALNDTNYDGYLSNAFIFNPSGAPVFSTTGAYGFLEPPHYEGQPTLSHFSSNYYDDTVNGISCSWHNEVYGHYRYYDADTQQTTTKSFCVTEQHYSDLIEEWITDPILTSCCEIVYDDTQDAYLPVVAYIHDMYIGMNDYTFMFGMQVGTSLENTVTWSKKGFGGIDVNLDPYEDISLNMAIGPFIHTNYCVCWSGSNPDSTHVLYSNDGDWNIEGDVVLNNTAGDVWIDTYDGQHYGVVYSRPLGGANWAICYRYSSDGGASWSAEECIDSITISSSAAPNVAIHYSSHDQPVIIYPSGIGENFYNHPVIATKDGGSFNHFYLNDLGFSVNYDHFAASPGNQPMGASFSAGTDVYYVYNTPSFPGGLVASGDTDTASSNALRCSGLYPNPSRGMLTVCLDCPEDTEVRPVLYDLAGRRVSELPTTQIRAGANSLRLNLNERSNLEPGVYSLVIDSGDELVRERVVISD